MYACGKHLFHSTYELACASQEINIINMKYIVGMYISEIEEIHTIDWDMREHIDICFKESEKRAAYP